MMKELKKLSILNVKPVNYLDQPLFLGEGLSIQRYDKCKYEIFLELFEKQQAFFWRPSEINLTKDRADFKKLTDSEKFIFTSNLKFQTMMDSVIARGIPCITQYVSSPELEVCLNTQAFFENIHSFSYTYLIKNVFHNPSEVMDSILEDEEILARAKSVTSSFDKLNKTIKDENDLRSQIYLTLINMNVLEAVRFYVSFACALAFDQNKKMCGNAQIIKLIRRDEGIHMFVSQNIIKILRENKSEGFQGVIKSLEKEAIQVFLDAAEEEKAWASYIFKDGGLIGLNAKIMHQYIEYLTDARLEGVSLPKQFGTKNPINWLEMDSTKEQTAPQEQEITSYKVAASVNDVDNMDFGFLE